ncbi:MAG: DEAD/DEAH box helicase [Clostridiales bacterium]|nr:DEAD/DEAH box helicase [Clostridiales bacterium]
MDDKYKITFTESAFSADIQRSNLQYKKKFTRQVAEAQQNVEALDSHDDFHELLIDSSHYKKGKGKSEYGIAADRDIHGTGGDVILSHQQSAAEKFLRDLRGFGLLADVVGSGKTYEAGVILSELAVRGKMKSLLIVTPDQVFNSWVDVLENKFGLGRDVLYKVQKSDGDVTLQDVLSKVGVNKQGKFIRPKRPIIVDVDIFAGWRYSEGFLADVVVVDEAHHFSEDAGKYAGAMRMLSEMMQTKKRAGSTYCLLLTATPHSGNLENMFRLWYFVRCKGGNPPDFDEKDDSDRTAQYVEEKQYYKDTVCYGATNITDFIRKVKDSVVMQKYIDEFYEYLEKTGDKGEFDSLSKYDRASYIDDFLNSDYGKKTVGYDHYINKSVTLKDDVLRRVSDAYHNGVLRSIMIRQPNRLPKKKSVHNYFFYPMSTVPDAVEIAGLGESKVTVDFSTVSEKGDPIVNVGSEKMPILDYAKNLRGRMPFEQAYAHVINSMLNNLAKTDPQSATIHKKTGYINYYADRLRNTPKEVALQSYFLPVELSNGIKDYKYKTAVDILKRHGDKRILVFFDYNLGKNERIYDQVCDELMHDPELKKRIIVGDSDADVHAVEREFNSEKRKNAILLVKDAKYTEGANLQESSIIINYQVTYDPLAMDQRIGRIFRLGQKNDVTVYSLADMNKLEGFALAYFAEIGLLSGNSGDATILAGSNSDQMVALRCNACGRVVLMSKEAYDEKRKKKGALYCRAETQCIGPDGNGTEMSEITVYDFKCDNCGTVLTRSVSEGYMCISSVENGERGRMCNSGEKGDRSIYCRKICAISHCRRFNKGGHMYGKCPVLKRYREVSNISDVELMRICAMCDNRDCWEKCKISGLPKEQIMGEQGEGGRCSDCDYAGCSPKPHALDFNDKWEADCPMPSCSSRHHHGKLRPVVARTFATFISELWKFDHDGGEGFCKNLGEQAEIVSDVRRILEHDSVEGGAYGKD